MHGERLGAGDGPEGQRRQHTGDQPRSTHDQQRDIGRQQRARQSEEAHRSTARQALPAAAPIGSAKSSVDKPPRR